MIREQSGYTLVEAMVAIVVLGLVIGGISNLFITILRTQYMTSNLEAATRAAQREIESLRNNNYNTLEPGTNIDFTDRLPDNLPSGKQGTVAISEPVPGLRRVDVNVTYTDNGAERQVNLSSLIGVIGIAQ